MAKTALTLRMVANVNPVDANERLATGVANFQTGLKEIENFLRSARGATRGAKFFYRVDSVAAVSATQTVACTQASFTAGDVLNVGGAIFTAKASGSVAANGEFDAVTSNTVTGDNLAAAINAMPYSKARMSAVNATGTVTITWLEAGSAGNSVPITKVVTNSGAMTLGGATLSGGKDEMQSGAPTATLTHANITANDTLKIGSVTLTWKASPSGENEVLIGANATADGDNLVTKINAHSKLQGLIVASNNAGIVTMTYVGAGREAALITLSKTESAAGTSLSASDFSGGSTLAYQGATQSYSNGAA